MYIELNTAITTAPCYKPEFDTVIVLKSEIVQHEDVYIENSAEETGKYPNASNLTPL